MATQHPTSDERCGLPAAVIDDLLADETRRIALRILAEHGEPMVVESLARAVVAEQDDCAEAAVSAAAREIVREELFTEHLPKLTATGVVEYDSMLGTVDLRLPAILE